MRHWQRILDRIDRLSRTRALTDAESDLLEQAITEMTPDEDAQQVCARHWGEDEDA